MIVTEWAVTITLLPTGIAGFALPRNGCRVVVPTMPKPTHPPASADRGLLGRHSAAFVTCPGPGNHISNKRLASARIFSQREQMLGPEPGRKSTKREYAMVVGVQSFTLTAMTPEDARIIRLWSYEPPYEIYGMDDDSSEAELLNTRSPHYAVRAGDADPVGFFAFGTAALPWSTAPDLYGADGEVSIGLGMRPDATGRGAGLAFLRSGLEFAREAFRPSYFRLFVYGWNERAIRVYERAGFRRVGNYAQPDGDEFWEMRLTE
ncbi:GNAT family N-acetyltransferase [Nocardia sp. JCM 34519.1]|uniref:GNAT family N-acetyltransferase n=1 Tax=Nocardia sp. JCM 34519.1 TaxID=2876119 RepID=UPI001CE3EFA7|nr:GNAT family protein [Nocardia sp. JCM 34519.1]